MNKKPSAFVLRNRIRNRLTEEQKRKFDWALDNETDWPKLTDDPEVNYAVDEYNSDGEDYPWFIVSEEIKNMYRKEVSLAIAAGEEFNYDT